MPIRGAQSPIQRVQLTGPLVISPPRRVGIDVRTVEPRMRGIGLSVYHLVRALAVASDGPELVLFGHAQSAKIFEGLARTTHHVIPHLLGDPRWEGRDAQVLCQRLGVELYHGASFTGMLTGDLARVVTIYDLAFITHPDFYGAAFRREMTRSSRHGAARADHVITLSQDSAIDLARELDLPDSKIAVIPPGLDPIFVEQPTTPDAPFPWAAKRRRFVLLAVGLGQARKNTVGIIDAMALLPDELRRETTLVIVGEEWGVNEAAHQRARARGLLDQIVVTGPLERDQMPAVYRQASVLVFPSFQEGYGLPVIEALACGLPVVTSKVGGVRELKGAPMSIVDPGDPEDIARAITQVLEDPTLTDEARRDGPPCARALSWDQAAKKTLEVYREAYATRHRRNQSSPRRLSIGVDARFLGQRAMGTGRYSTELMEQLFCVMPDVRWMLFAPPAGVVDALGVRLLVESRLEQAGRIADGGWEAGPLRAAIEGADLDVYLGLAGLIPPELSVPSVVVAYDLGFIRHPEFYPPGLLAYLQRRLPESFRAATRVVAISESTREDLAKFLGIAEERVSVASPGADHLPGLTRNVASPPYVLSVSSGGRNKNLEGVLAGVEAFVTRHPDHPLQLHLVGSQIDPGVRARTEAGPLASRVRLLPGLDDDGLAVQLAGASALVFLSRFEGFGLPVVEAMRAGVPVIGSPAVAEVARGAGIIVGEDSPDELADALEVILDPQGRSREFSMRGRLRAHSFRWVATAHQVAEVLTEVGEERPARTPPAVEEHVGLITTWGIMCGIGEYSRTLADALVADGHAITILAEDADTLVTPDPPRLEVVRCWRRGHPLERLLQAILDRGLSLVHVQYQVALFPNPAALADLTWQLRGAGITVVLTLHEIEPDQLPPGWLMPDHLIAHSELVRGHLVQRHRLTTPIEMIPIGISPAESTEERSSRGAQILSWGFLHPHKGFEDVIAALPGILARFPAARYRIYGPRQSSAPSYPERLRAQAQQLGVDAAVEIVEGYLQGAERERELAQADVVVYPYRRTPLGSSASVGPSLAAGKAIVASRTPFFADLDGAARLVDQSSQLGPAIESLLSDPSERAQLEQRARALAADRAWPRIAQRHAALYRETHATRLRARQASAKPVISVQIIAREADALGLAWYRSCLESLVGHPDQLVIVDNGSSPEVLDMVRSMMASFPEPVLIEAPEVQGFQDLRNRALAATRSDATYVHWVDTDEIFFPHQLVQLREAMADPRFSRWATILVHFMIDPTRVETRHVKWNLFRYGPQLRWSRGVHEIMEGVPEGRWGFAPIDHLHFGYCRPQWQTFIKWLRYAVLEHGRADMYRSETVDGLLLPWLREGRTPMSILNERIPLLSAYQAPYPASCQPWLEDWKRSGLSWPEYAEARVDPTPRFVWERSYSRNHSWSATLDEMLAYFGIQERPPGAVS